MTQPVSTSPDAALADFVSQPFGYVYAVTHRASGRFYIGQTRRTVAHRWSVHKSEAKRRPRGHFHKAVAAHGPGAFDIQPVATASNQDELNRLETLWIIATGALVRALGYNAGYGGDSYVRTSETIAKMRASLTGRKLSADHVAAMSAGKRGRPQSEAHKRARSVALKGRGPTAVVRAAVAAANRTRVYSESTRAKLRACAKKANEVRWGQRHR